MPTMQLRHAATSGCLQGHRLALATMWEVSLPTAAGPCMPYCPRGRHQINDLNAGCAFAQSILDMRPAFDK